MTIDLNKDFEETFPDEVYSGFTLPQVIVAVTGIAVCIGLAVFLWKYVGIPIVQCTYISVPLMVPICALGFFQYQKQSLLGILREMWYSRKTKILTYHAQEYSEEHARVYTMNRPQEKQGKKRRRRHGSH